MRTAILLCVLVPCYFACEDLPRDPRPTSSNPSRVIDLEFEGDFNGVSDEWHLLEMSARSKFNFHIEQYNNIDSIIFKASLRSERENVRCVVELFNLTDDTEIGGSTLFSIIRYQLHSVRSADLRYNFPNNEI